MSEDLKPADVLTALIDLRDHFVWRYLRTKKAGVYYLPPQVVAANDAIDRAAGRNVPITAGGGRDLHAAPATTAGQQGEARPAPTAPNLACPSVQARLAEQWGYTREDDGERDTLRALLREAREGLRDACVFLPSESWSVCRAIAGRIDAALADGGAR